MSVIENTIPNTIPVNTVFIGKLLASSGTSPFRDDVKNAPLVQRHRSQGRFAARALWSRFRGAFQNVSSGLSTVPNGLVTAVSYCGLTSSGIGRRSCCTSPKWPNWVNSAPTHFVGASVLSTNKGVSFSRFAVVTSRYLQREFGKKFCAACHCLRC